jgi:hypothetical protein
MNLKNAVLAVGAAACLSSAAFADGFSTTLDVPIVPTQNFSVRLGLNYSLEVVKNLFIGASLNPSYTPSDTANPFALKARVGAKYVLLLAKTSSSILNASIGAGVNASILPSPFGLAADINGGLDGVFGLGGGFKLYGEMNGRVSYEFTPGLFGYFADTTLGVFVEPIQNLEWRLQGTVGVTGAFNNTAALLSWIAESSLYYTIVPQFKIGAIVGFGATGANQGVFTFGIRALFVEKPETLGLPGAYLP